MDEFFERHSDANEFFLTLIAQIDGLHISKGDQCRLDGHRVYFSHWWFDFGKAEIGNASGRWNSHHIELPNNNKMRCLFLDRKHHLVNFGQKVSFTDPVWGKIKVDLSTNRIKRGDRGKWSEYDHLNGSLATNLALKLDYALWRYVGLPSYYCDLKTGECCYVIHQDGRLCSIDGSKEFVNNAVKEFSIYETVKAFEDEEHLSCFINRTAEWSLEFHRFKTPLGGVLSFVFNRVDQLWRFSDNLIYFLDLNPLRDWGFNECLNLINDEGSRRLVLIPFGEISSTGYNPRCKITLPSRDEAGNKGALSYFEYEVKDNELVLAPSMASFI